MEVTIAWRRVEKERMVVEFESDSVEIGNGRLRALIAEAAAQEVMRRTTLETGWHHFNVKDAPMEYFATNQGGKQRRQIDGRLMQLRRESRGLEFDGAGVVQTRPMQKFHSMGQLSGAEEDSLLAAQVVTVTDKMDGEMMCGERWPDRVVAKDWLDKTGAFCDKVGT